MKKKKTTPQPRNHLVRLVMFRKAGAHRKTNKAIRRLEKSKKLFPIIYNFDFLYIIRNNFGPIAQLVRAEDS